MPTKFQKCQSYRIFRVGPTTPVHTKFLEKLLDVVGQRCSEPLPLYRSQFVFFFILEESTKYLSSEELLFFSQIEIVLLYAEVKKLYCDRYDDD